MSSKVLITGGSGFVASHILELLLNNGYHVVTTVRSAQKGEKILQHHQRYANKLSYVVVEDIAKEDAFDEASLNSAVACHPPLDFVIHTASPYHFNVQDPVRSFHEPAVLGTTGVLKSVAKKAPTVRRVVLTSTFGTMVEPHSHAKVYDEDAWGTVTAEQSMDPKGAYRAGKIFAEKAAWAFMREQQPHFDLATIHPPMVYGPASPFIDSIDELNTSNDRIRAMVQGDTLKTGFPPTIVYLFADVRDVALAHVRSLEKAEAGGQRFLVTGGYYSNKAICEAVRQFYPHLSLMLPAAEAIQDDTPDNVYGYNNEKSRKVLGLTYRTMNECIRDAVESILQLELKARRRSI
ncbi:putative NAD-dependent epimerase/dehydratase domain-containing protein [Seiridium cardinale]